MTVSESKMSLSKDSHRSPRHVRFGTSPCFLPFATLSRFLLFCCTVQKTSVCVCLLQNWLARKCNMYGYNTFSSFFFCMWQQPYYAVSGKMNVHHDPWILADSTHHSTVRLHQGGKSTHQAHRQQRRNAGKKKQSCNGNKSSKSG